MPGSWGVKREKDFTVTPKADPATLILDIHSGAKRLINTVHAEEEKKIRDAVANFLLNSINIANLNDDDRIFESGIANSLFAVQLMTFLEKNFAIEIGMDDLDIANFASISSATAFVMKKKGWRKHATAP
jgi:methoxymalonate biosynthesis acyl carrier protein